MSNLKEADMECFCFVILHYKIASDTINCVNSIINIANQDIIKVVVVDNGSGNNSGYEVEKTFKAFPNFHMLYSAMNLGFAKGNNIGFQFAKNNLDASFIAMINNDTLIKQADFVTKTIEKYSLSRFDILGPDIIDLQGNHQSPMDSKVNNIDQLELKIKQYKRLLKMNYLGIDSVFLSYKKGLSKIKRIQPTGNINFYSEQSGVTLHGSAMIFSKNYVRRYEGLYPDTFMYGEEAILNFIAKRDGLNVIYSPEIKITHLDDSATNYVFTKSHLKRRFYLKNALKSLNVLKNLMQS